MLRDVIDTALNTAIRKPGVRSSQEVLLPLRSPPDHDTTNAECAAERFRKPDCGESTWRRVVLAPGGGSGSRVAADPWRSRWASPLTCCYSVDAGWMRIVSVGRMHADELGTDAALVPLCREGNPCGSRRYSASVSPEPPSSAGKSLIFGRPSFMGSTVDS